MFFLQNRGKYNKPPILLLHSYTIYPGSSLGYFTDFLQFSQLTPQNAFFGFHNIDTDTFLIQNHILLLLKLRIYNTRNNGLLSFNNFLNEISKIKNLERRVALNNWNKCGRFRNK